MKKLIQATLSTLVISSMWGCGSSDDQSKTSADPVVVNPVQDFIPGFEDDILPILKAADSNCTSCHVAGQSGVRGGWIYDYATMTTNATLNVKRFVGAITHQPGFRPMPMVGTPLDAAERALVLKWSTNGTPKNRVIIPTPVVPVPVVPTPIVPVPVVPNPIAVNRI